MTRPRPGLLIFFVIYGGVLFAAGVLLTGFLDGPRIALAVFSSPLSVWRGIGLFGTIWLWPLVGLLLAFRRHVPAMVLVVLHYLCIPAGVLANLRGGYSFHDEWSLMIKFFSVPHAVLWLPYLVGQVAFWRTTLSRSASGEPLQTQGLSEDSAR